MNKLGLIIRKITLIITSKSNLVDFSFHFILMGRMDPWALYNIFLWVGVRKMKRNLKKKKGKCYYFAIAELMLAAIFCPSAPSTVFIFEVL